MEPHWLEFASWGSNVVLAACGVFALLQIKAAVTQAREATAQTKLLLNQLKDSQDEFNHRSKRDAIASALEQSAHWASEVLPEYERLHEIMRGAKYNFPQKVEDSFPCSRTDGKLVYPTIQGLPPASIIGLLNKVEAFAMHFESGLADESVAFAPVAQGYCSVCISLSEFVCAFRPAHDIKLFPNLVQLYQRWHPRLLREGLDVRMQVLADQKNGLPPDKRAKPLGTDRF